MVPKISYFYDNVSMTPVDFKTLYFLQALVNSFPNLASDFSPEIQYKGPTPWNSLSVEQPSAEILGPELLLTVAASLRTFFPGKAHQHLAEVQISCSESQKLVNGICHKCDLENQMGFCLSQKRERGFM